MSILSTTLSMYKSEESMFDKNQHGALTAAAARNGYFNIVYVVYTRVCGVIVSTFARRWEGDGFDARPKAAS